MSAHAAYVAAAYGATVIVLGLLIAWILADRRRLGRAYAALEEAGVRRRSKSTAETRS